MRAALMRLIPLVVIFLLLAGFSQAEENQFLPLPELKGWQSSAPDFLKFTSEPGKAFYVKRFYDRPDGARLEVLFAGGSQGAKLARSLKGRLEVETPEFVLRYRKIDGYPALVSFAPKEKKGFIAIFLKEDPALLLLARFSSLTDQDVINILRELGWPKLIAEGLAYLKN